MKKLLLLLAPLTLGLMVGCSYDDSAILDKITELEKEQDEMQAQIDAQQTLLYALANNLTITAVTQNDNGYTITFSDGSFMTIKNGEQGENSGQVNSFIESIVVGEEDVTFTLTDGTVIVIPLGSNSGDTSSEDNKIYYTTSDNTRLFPKTDANLYGAILISNTYKDGQGILVFDDAVTMIGSSAFSGCTSLTSITIPESVTEIGEAVFYGCSSLKEFKGKFASEDGRCLVIDGKLVAFAPFGLTQYSIPDSVTEIGERTFEDCSSLTSVTIGNGVTSIGNLAFDGCSSLTSATIGNGVTSIGWNAFSGCTSLTSITIPDSVTSIGGQAFYGCTGELIINSKIVETDYNYESYPAYNYNGWLNGATFTKLTIGNNVTSIGESAFRDCSSLTSVTTGNSVTSIGTCAFYYCTSLTSVTMGNGVTSIGKYAFYGCSSLTSITIPDSAWIGEDAFYRCSSLTDTYVNITDLAAYATYNISSRFPGAKHLMIDDTEITELVIPDSVTSIGNLAFDGCSSLTSVTIPDSVTEIGDEAFYCCSSLTSITIPDSVTSIGEWAFSYCYSLTSITIPDSVTEIGKGAFCGCSSLTSITIPDSVTSIGGRAFYDCTGELIINSKVVETDYNYESYPAYYGWLKDAKFTKLTIGNNVTSIGNYAFYECTSLTSITIGNGITSIGENTFRDCSSLTSITIPDSVTEIGNYAFNSCTSLTSITIPESVTSIGYYAFRDCSSLIEVYCKPTTPPSGGYNTFSNNALDRKIYVPTESVEAYKNVYYWSEYADSIEGYDFE